MHNFSDNSNPSNAHLIKDNEFKSKIVDLCNSMTKTATR